MNQIFRININLTEYDDTVMRINVLSMGGTLGVTTEFVILGMTPKLSNIVSCDFHFKTKFLFRNAYDISINNQNQTFSKKSWWKTTFFLKNWKQWSLLFKKNWNEKQQ